MLKVSQAITIVYKQQNEEWHSVANWHTTQDNRTTSTTRYFDKITSETQRKHLIYQEYFN